VVARAGPVQGAARELSRRVAGAALQAAAVAPSGARVVARQLEPFLPGPRLGPVWAIEPSAPFRPTSHVVWEIVRMRAA
jgi:hypothetical protein